MTNKESAVDYPKLGRRTLCRVLVLLAGASVAGAHAAEAVAVAANFAEPIKAVAAVLEKTTATA